MRRNFYKICVIAVMLISVNSFSQQIITDNTMSIQDLITNNLDAECVDISNISSPVNGNTIGIGSFGSFQRGNSNFPFESGIILSTGNIISAGNTENDEVLNDGDTSWLTDNDLETALGISNTLNATSVEFDFISISNTLQFNYILASEEYFANFPCEYSDGFALLIREASSNGPYTNIALVPGTNTPVNTTTIHDEIAGFCEEVNSNYFEGYNVGDTNYNGRTTVLTATANLIPNTAYRIKLVIADQTDRNYDSAVFIEANSFSPTVNLGDDFSTCADEIILDGDINNPDAQYDWLLNGNQITGANQPQYSASESGNYEVIITIPLGDGFCTISDNINIDLSNTQSSTPMSNYVLCDDPSNDGQEIFDLNTKTAEAINSVGPGNYEVTYYTSLPNAQNEVNPISGNYTNAVNPQLIFVRIEDTNTGCLAYNQFELQVNARPEIVDPPLMQVCDDQVVDGFTTINLNDNNTIITNGQSNLVVTYHQTLTQAENGFNPIPMPYVNDTQVDLVYVSVVDPAIGCRVTTTLDIEVLLPPDINNTQPYFIDACDPDYDGFANFDLTSVEAEILNGLTDVTVSYHTNQADALSGDNPIANPTNFANTVQTEQVIYIRVVDNNTGCPSIAPIEIHPNLLLSEPNFDDIDVCDEGNDGVESFNLQNISNGILGNLDNVVIDFYETEDDRDNAVNAIDTSTDYTPTSLPQILYLTLTSPTCTEVEDIILNVNTIDTFPDIGQQFVCDEDQDGLTTVNLTEYEDLLTQGLTGYTVTFFETQQDADDNTNTIGNFYSNTTNPFTVFVRITSQATGCADTSNFEIVVNPAPEATNASPIVVCDDNQDGFYEVNLEDRISEIITDTTNRLITFHNSAGNANSGNNPISNPDTYNAETETIFVRIEDTTTGCYSVRTIPIIINTLPVFTDISDYIFCENNSDDIGDFILNSKDAEILNGQTGKEVLYFNSENDALNNINEINKNVPYENTINPETIYVRVQNISDNNCFGVSSFVLSVGTNPEFNEPSDIFICGDGSNESTASINLDEKTNEILSGFSTDVDVAYYATIEDFNSNSNPISGGNFTNTSNPQEIYVRIENDTNCFSTTSFTISVIPTPTVSEIAPFEDCDVDYDESILWDLTQAEINILDIRQDNIVVSYFTSEDDANSDTNAIADPENFENTSNPQVVYIKVVNTDFNCPVVIPIELNVIAPPPFNQFGSTVICDNDEDSYNLDQIDALLGNNSQSIEITYYSNEQDAINVENVLDNDYTYQSNNDILYARIENSFTGCYYIYPFMIEVNDRPEVDTIEDLEDCDDNDDGQLLFDLEMQTEMILGSQDPSIISVTYHTTESEALSALNEINGLYNATDGDIIYVRLTNTDTGCYRLTQFNILVHPLPVVEFESQTICPENFPFVADAYTGNDADTYSWSTGEAFSEIEIRESGIYSVTITTEYGCQTTEEFEIIVSEPAIIETVETIDFSDPNNITITVSGIGDYLFQLDGGALQDSGLFENVTLGYHTLTIIDQNGCASVTKEVLVIDAPKHMTPNNDGDFDTWHIIGVETLPGTVVNIFDRYGKLLKQLSHNSPGWDGTYNGNPMPASDYWWSADVKRGDIEFVATGHFALRR